MDYDYSKRLDYNKILDNLYLGKFLLEINDAYWLNEKIGYTAVLNLQTDADIKKRKVNLSALEKFFKWKKIEFRRHPIEDYSDTALRWALPEAVKTLKELLDQGHIVYLHCNSGINRSPTVTVAYLHWFKKMSLLKSIKYVRTRRPGVAPIIGAMMSKAFEYICSDCDNEQNNEEKCEKCNSNNLIRQDGTSYKKSNKSIWKPSTDLSTWLSPQEKPRKNPRWKPPHRRWMEDDFE